MKERRMTKKHKQTRTTIISLQETLQTRKMKTSNTK